MIDEIVHNISSLSELLGLDPVLVCITLREEFTEPDEKEDEELYNILNEVYDELVKIEENTKQKKWVKINLLQFLGQKSKIIWD